MAEITNVVIGVQARSTSERLPRKWAEMIDDKTVIQHVLDACHRSAHYVNKKSWRTNVIVRVALAIPEGDEIGDVYKHKETIIQGSETDVLSRYAALGEQMKADFIVRVTGDCPLIPPFIITKHINTAVQNFYDYTSDVGENWRTMPDGLDCEVFSRRMLEYAAENAVDPYDREHVTTFMRKYPPQWAKTGAVVGFLPFQDIKVSVDTQEDLEFVRKVYSRVKASLTAAEAEHGKPGVHRV